MVQLLRYRNMFLDDRTNGRAYATMLRPSVVCGVCIVAKRCVIEQKLLLTRSYRKSYMRNRLVGHVNHCVTFAIEYLGKR